MTGVKESDNTPHWYYLKLKRGGREEGEREGGRREGAPEGDYIMNLPL